MEVSQETTIRLSTTVVTGTKTTGGLASQLPVSTVTSSAGTSGQAVSENNTLRSTAELFASSSQLDENNRNVEVISAVDSQTMVSGEFNVSSTNLGQQVVTLNASKERTISWLTKINEAIENFKLLSTGAVDNALDSLSDDEFLVIESDKPKIDRQQEWLAALRLAIQNCNKAPS
jgi:hypothetical protein